MKLNIFRKSCLAALVLLLTITIISYELLYFLLPHYYSQYKTEQFNELTEFLISEIKDSNSSELEGELLRSFAQNNNVSIQLYDGNSNILLNYSYESALTVEESTIFSENSDSTEISMASDIANEDASSDHLKLSYSYKLTGQDRTLTISVPMQPLDEAKAVIVRIFPIAAVICILFSFVLALIFSWQFARPIQKIREKTHDMAQLKHDSFIDIKSKDEVGLLAKDINYLYTELNSTIHTLKHELDHFLASENRQLDEFRTISHELKTPLAAANSLLYGIIYEISPYCDNEQKYLKECEEQLEKAIVLTKELLDFSRHSMPKTTESCNLYSLFEEGACGYFPLIKAKHIDLSVDIPQNITLKTRPEMFVRVISNLMSNAVNYTLEAGKIDISYINDADSSRLIFKNTCTPLSTAEISRIFSADYSGNPKSSSSSGFGLYIINQFLNILRIAYSFEPTLGKDGMQFIIYLNRIDSYTD